MLLQHLTTAALGLALTNAFLLVPEIPDEAVDSLKAIKALPFDKISIAETRKVNLDCPHCPLYFADSDGNIKLQADKKSVLELDFAIDHQAGGDRLLVNDFELYPNTDPFSHMLSADLKADGKKKHQQQEEKSVSGAVPLGFSMLVNPAIKSQEDNMELVGIELHIIEVMNTFVDGIPSIYIELIKSPENALMIGAVKVVEVDETVEKPQDSQSKCDTALCKWGAMLDDMFAKIKPFKFKHCGGKGKAIPVEVGEGDAPRKHHPHHHHPGHRVRKHSWGQLFKNIVSHVLLPILVGIVAGVSVSLIGMMVGTCIIALWRAFFRPHHRHVGHAHHKSVQKEIAVEEEKAGLMAEQEAPPTNEELDAKH